MRPAPHCAAEEEQMNQAFDWIFDHSRTILVILLMAVIGGWAALVNIPREGEPDIDLPFLYVSANFPGVSVQDNEVLVSKVMEEEFVDLAGLTEMTSYVSDGHTGIFLRFEIGFDKDRLIDDLRAKLDAIRPKLPADMEDPTIIERSINDEPIINVTLAGSVPQRTLSRIADDLADDLLNLNSVKEVEVSGTRTEIVEVLVDPVKLETYNVSVEELLNATNANNTLIQAGDVTSDGGAFAVKLSGTFASVEDVAATALAFRDGPTLTIGDVAEVRRTYRERSTAARVNGDPAILLRVSKALGANIFESVDEVKRKVDEAAGLWPEALRELVDVSYAFDETKEALGLILHLQNAVITAVILIFVMSIILIGPRPAILVAAAVPASFLIAFLLLSIFGLTINNMVLFGLTLSVGMLIDGAIVVVEYADRRRAEGVSGAKAFRDASKRMALPILASTATTLCAFLPLLFWPGIPGQFMRQLPITIIFVLSASLLVALVFLPVVGATLYSLVPASGRRRAAPTLSGVKTDDTRFARILRSMLRVPAVPFLMLAGVAAIIGVIVTQYAGNNRGVEFFVETEPEQLVAQVRARGNLSFEQRDRLVREVELRTVGIEGVRSQISSAGGSERGRDAPSDSIGSIYFELEEWDRRPKASEITREIARRSASVPGVIVDITEPAEGPSDGKPISIELSSTNWERLLASVQKIRDRMDQDPGLTNIEDSRPLPGIEWDLEVDRARSASLGADIQSIGTLVRLLTRGVTIGAYRPDDSRTEIDIVARFPGSRRTLESLEQLRLRTDAGLIPLSSVVTAEPRRAIDAITRRDGKRWISIAADAAEGENVFRKIEELKAWIATQEFPPEVQLKVAGQDEERNESQRFLSIAFGLALLLMFAVLLLEFNNFFAVIMVLLAVILSFVGVMLGMLVMNQPFSVIMTGIGVVALAGIVVNNNIILVDTYQSLRQRMHEMDAIAGAVVRRIRPVLLTTFTTMVGLCPMMLSVSIDYQGRDIAIGTPSGEWWTQLATAIVFGLGFSALLTLIVTPSALAIRHWITMYLRQGGGWAHAWVGGRRKALEFRARRRTWKELKTRGGEVLWTEADSLLPLHGPAAPLPER